MSARQLRLTDRSIVAGPCAALLIALAACGMQTPAPPPHATQAASLPAAQPPNVGDTKIAATEYYNSGAYERDLAAVATEAMHWVTQRAPQVSNPALVLDIDDTALSNWEVIVADDFGRVIDGPCDHLPKGPCGWAAWDMLGRDRAIAPTLQLFRQARAANTAVFFITGRPESQRGPTERNLRTAGYTDYAGIRLTPINAHYASAADFKTPQREDIERAGYTIIANMGDQPSDLMGGHAEKTFLLPNPFYRIP
jgi:predicted secreted acid phosphatase